MKNKPIIAQAPMDGVSDAAFRFITDKYGKSDMLFTEFSSVEGITHGAVKLLNALIHHKTATPTIAQLYGSHPQDFYNAVFVVCEMGFDGVDINMGCPEKSIAARGAGAALILNPKLAQEIILSVKQAAQDYANGRSIEEVSLPLSIIRYVKAFQITNKIKPKRAALPVSVKTRTGYDQPVTKSWINALLETAPAAITLHGRTFKQLYTRKSNWEEIGLAAELAKKTKTMILGNGDIKSLAEAKDKNKQYGLDGVMIGRASLGNPWIFQGLVPTEKERIKVALEHCEAFAKLTPTLYFPSLRKHLSWYVTGLTGSHKLRNRLMTVNTINDVRQILL